VNLPRSIDGFRAPRASLLKGGVGQEQRERSELLSVVLVGASAASSYQLVFHFKRTEAPARIHTRGLQAVRWDGAWRRSVRQPSRKCPSLRLKGHFARAAEWGKSYCLGVTFTLP
jgi:hypothetical protein